MSVEVPPTSQQMQVAVADRLAEAARSPSSPAAGPGEHDPERLGIGASRHGISVAAQSAKFSSPVNPRARSPPSSSSRVAR